MRSNIDIALFLPSLSRGGAEKVFLALSGLFVQHGLNVDLLVAQPTGIRQARIPDGVKLICLGKSKPSRSVPALVRYLRDNRPKVVLSALTHANIALVIAHKFSNVESRLVLSERTNLANALSRYGSNLDAWLTKLLARQFYPLADAIVAVSQGAAISLIQTLRLSTNDVSVIYNPVFFEKINESARESIKFPWDDSLPVMISAGRLSNEKDFPMLMRSFTELQKQLPAHLVILGEGEERVHLERLANKFGIAKNVWLPGYIGNPYPYIARANLFVLSSRFEGLPNVLIEALALNVPVVSTRCPSGPEEILDNGRYGHLVPVGNDAALTEAMAKSLNGENPRFDRLEALERFDHEKVTNEYLRVLGFKNLEA
ncbi:glycosyltransferase [Desulfobulbus sp.]|uniref:glycosyltransferase n=1 Tax=Desulfobulbus sp. TaxID=895 RepID=UPI0027BAC7F8|nr:glycosyltransferase [Desulfobulbus sp.]